MQNNSNSQSSAPILGDGFKATPVHPTANPAKTSVVAPVQQQAPAAPVTPPVKEEPKAPVADPKQIELDKRFNALIAKERAVTAKAQQAAQRAKQAEARIAELESQLKGRAPVEEVKASFQNDLKARALQNPLDVMKDLGLTYEQLTQFILNDNKPTPELIESRLQREIASIREDQAKSFEAQKAAIEQQRLENKRQAEQQYKQATDQVKMEISEFVTARPEDFALIAKNEASDTVFEVMNQHYTNTGRIMNVEEACKLVEDYFEEQALDLLKVAKLQAKLGQKPGTPSQAQASDTAPATDHEAAPKTKPKWTPSTTLTHTAVTDGSAVPAKEKLSYEQRKAQLLAKYALNK